MKKFAGVFLLMVAGAAPAFAAFEPVGIGARGRSMGEAYTAAADDYSAAYWNPAALPGLDRQELAFSYEDRYTLGLVGMTHLAYVNPGFGPGGMGISWTRLAATKEVGTSRYSENTYTFAYGVKALDGLNLGTSLNFYRLISDIDGSGFGLNFSARYRVNGRLTFGLLGQNLAATTIRYEGMNQDKLFQDIRAGLAWTPKDYLKIAFDLDNLVPKKPMKHLGMEFNIPSYKLAVRAGLSEKDAQGFAYTYSFGASLNYTRFGIDYSVENHFDLGLTHLLALRMKL